MRVGTGKGMAEREQDPTKEPTAEHDPDGDATTEFSPNSGGEQADQMPSEYGARGTNASGNRAEEGRTP